MTIQIPQNFLETLAAERSVSEAELEALSLALEGQSTAAIANLLGISAIAVRKRLGEVYRKFNISGSGPGKLPELKHQILSYYQSRQISASSVEPSPGTTVATRQDWGEAPDVSVIWGRNTELATLEQWIQEGCRLVALFGMGGIGKTALSVKLAKYIQSEFEYVIWRSLRQSPSLSDLLTDLLQFIGQTVPEEEDKKIGQLIACLHQHKCLLVLDGVETILQAGQPAGSYKPGYENYGKLIVRLGEQPHQSCIVITSREKLQEILPLIAEAPPVRAFQLEGLKPEEGENIFQAKGLSDRKNWKQLIQCYRGNPLELKLAATMIYELFDGRVAEFLKRDTFVFGGIHALLAEQFERLSYLEKVILYELSIAQRPVSIEQLQGKIWLPVTEAELFVSESVILEALSSLERRSLLETISKEGEPRFTLQPVLIRYLINRFLTQICQEILTLLKNQPLDKVEILKSHALTYSDESKDVRAMQIETLILPINQNLIKIFRTEDRTIEQLKRVQSTLEKKDWTEIGYAIDNINSLLAALKEK